ncbi:MAG: helix-turn-helix domain-containing protein [Ramlibacter sp.]
MKDVVRPYDQSSRRVQAGLTREMVLQAARDLLAREADAARFTLDAVALRAGVSRATVFNLFGGKPGLLNALFDEMSGRAGLMDVDALLTQADPHRALADYVERFGDFYGEGRAVLRKLRAYAALDADFARVVQARDDKRIAGLLYLVRRLQPNGARPTTRQRLLAAKLKALLGLEVFESIAGPGRSPREASAVVLEMAQAILGRR